MFEIELIPDLEQCIETVARKEHARVLARLLASGQRNRELEEKLEILRLFLETADFKKLRAESEKMLLEGKRVRFLVYSDNGVKYEIRVT
ncbi:MAG: hypothetical protein PHF74_08070 [Dehalococcoidales bacterium]|nr:hypothetical protein [Dehalococcoidales bacterium]